MGWRVKEQKGAYISKAACVSQECKLSLLDPEERPGRTPPPVAPEGSIPSSQNSFPLPSGASCFVPHPPICCLYMKDHTPTCPSQVSGLVLRAENSELFLQAPLRDDYSANLPTIECVESGCGERGIRGLTWLLGWSSVDCRKPQMFFGQVHLVGLISLCLLVIENMVPSVELSVKVKSLSHVRLSVTPWTVACQAPLSMGFFQARVLEWVAIFFSRGLPNPGIKPGSPALQADVLPSESPGKSELPEEEE